MKAPERVRQFLHWGQLAYALAIGLPFAVAAALGFVWLYERDMLLWFGLASAGLYAVVRLALLIPRWRPASQDEERSLPSPEPDPNWSQREVAAFERARVRIAKRLETPKEWTELPAEALAVVEEVAADMSEGQRSALDFTLPEALLLIDQVATRYRTFLLENVPYSDRLSVRTMHWLWRTQDSALSAWERGFFAWRGVRLVLNPAVALVREAERALAASVQSRLTDRFRRDAQAILLEEAAQAAVDLYSGRLRVSEAELAQRAADENARAALPAPATIAPRIVVIGQTGVGKSSLINALVGAEVAATDSLPMTKRMADYESSIGGVTCRLIDTPGIASDVRDRKALVRTMLSSDLVLWIHRFDRPARGPDAELWVDFVAARDAARQLPLVLHVASFADRLVPTRGETAQDLKALLADASEALGAELGITGVLPVSTAPTAWNLPTLQDRLANDIASAIRIRRAVLHADESQPKGLRANMKRAGRGLSQIGRAFFRRSG